MTKFFLSASLIRYYFSVLVFLLGIQHADAQSDKKLQEEDKQAAEVELLSAGELEMITEGGVETRYLRSNDSLRVSFKQEDMTLFCNEAIQFPDSNFLVAFGDVLFLKGDSVQMTGDTLYYYGNDRFAEMWSNITFSDSQMVLTTDQLEYRLDENLATYQYGGTIKDDSTTLTSKRGYYNTQTKLVAFSEDVVLDNPTSEYHLESDTLTYSTNTKIAYFHDITEITTRDGKLIAEKGQYDSQLSKSIFEKNARIENETYTLSGDLIDYDEVLEKGIAKGNVRLLSKEDTLVIYGDEARYYGLEGRTEVFGNALVEKPFGKADTLFVVSDTLISINDSISNTKMILAYPQVKLISGDMQGICDSLAYDLNDSTIHFYDDPVLWSESNQLEADTILAKLKDTALDKLYMTKKSFITSKDSLKNYNQIKGRDMEATFTDSYIRQVDVNGNAQSLYFALDNDTLLIGMNRMDCSNMLMQFADSNQLQTITSMRDIDAKFIPPHEIKSADTKLKDFNWREEERPSKDIIMAYFEKTIRMPLQEIFEMKEEEKEDTLLLVKKVMKPEFGELIGDGRFQVYQNEETVVIYHPNLQRVDARGKFYVDFFPVDTKDLPKEFRKQGYQSVEFIWEHDGTAKPMDRKVKLPDYPIIIIRVGQYIVRSNNRTEVWADAITIFPDGTTQSSRYDFATKTLLEK